jgi:hypothetical protein
MTLTARAVVTWLVLCVVMFANGAVRAVLLQPRLGEDTARQVASVTGVFLVLLASALFVRSAPHATSRQLLRVGAGWAAATLVFEFTLGAVSGLGWRQMLADYDVSRGRLWPLVVLAVALGPWLCRRLKGPRSAEPDRGHHRLMDGYF